MVEIVRLKEYTPEVADAMRQLMKELSRSGKDKGEIPETWFTEVTSSPWHDVLLAVEDGRIIGMATVSVVMGVGIRKNAYLEDFVVTADARGKGVSTSLWEEMLKWAKEKGARRLEFTCGVGRDAAHAFYHKHGATIYDTDFFRYEIGE